MILFYFLFYYFLHHPALVWLSELLKTLSSDPQSLSFFQVHIFASDNDLRSSSHNITSEQADRGTLAYMLITSLR